MTQPTENSWTRLSRRVGASVRGLGAWLTRTGAKLWLGLGAAAVLVLAAVVLGNAMVAPATRAGKPATTVAPLPVVSATPTPTPTLAQPSGSGSASPSQTPAKTPKTKSSGDFATAATEIEAMSSSGELRNYSVRVETSLKLKAKAVATQVAGVLNDPRSWTGSGGIRFGLVGKPKDADFTVTLAASGTSGKLCQADGAGVCTDGSDVVINASAWLGTPASFEGNAAEWQAYLVNHGLGQLLGEKAAKCPKKAKPAPVMMVQSGDLEGCIANPWPYP